MTNQNNKEKIKNCIIVDIDGTLANNKHRSPYATELCIDDELIIPVESICQHYKSCCSIVILVSGRYEKFRGLTEERLRKNDVNYDILYMRKDGDNRRDDIIKEEIYNEYIKDKYLVLFAIDDRHRVLDKRVELGIFTFSVNQTREEF